MYKVKEFYLAKSAEEALSKLKEHPQNAILGGSAYLRLWSKKKINCAIDISQAALRYIEVGDDELTIAASTRYHDFETNEILKNFAFAIFPKAFSNIVGVQLRNEVQVAASVCGKFGFSDLLPVLLALNASLQWLERGEESIDEFLSRPSSIDFLKEIKFKNVGKIKAASYDTVRYNSGDLPILNIAAALFSTSEMGSERTLRLAIGAMPGRARRVTEIETYLNDVSLSEWLSEECLNKCYDLLAGLKFGDDSKASAEYRREMAKVLLRRVLRDLLEQNEFDAVALETNKRGRIDLGNFADTDEKAGEKENEFDNSEISDRVCRLNDFNQKGEFYFYLNGERVERHYADLDKDCSLFEFLRSSSIYSVKQGCSSSCCGLCTVLIENEARLSCTVPLMRVQGLSVRTLEGEREEVDKFATLLAGEGADQCGFCNPGFILSVISLKRNLANPSDGDIQKYLSGNLCRCTGYTGQMRAIKKYLQI